MAKHRAGQRSATRDTNTVALPRLPAGVAKLLTAARAALVAGDLRSANAHWLMLSTLAPEHPLTFRLHGEVMWASGDAPRAADAWQMVLTSEPHDAALRTQLARALELAGKADDSKRVLQNAPDSSAADDWLVIGMELDRQGCTTEALAAADRALVLDAALPQARLLRARCLQISGDAPAAAAEYRAILAHDSMDARAWFGLVDLKTEAIAADELTTLRRAQAGLGDKHSSQLLAFALAKAEESAGHYERAFEVLHTGNRRAAADRPWDAARFSRTVDAMIEAFSGSDDAREAAPLEVVFITGLPRSGTTLIEQIVAAHADVSGAGELPYLENVIAAESHRRGQPFPRWAESASALDWQRLGRDYLRGAQRWRGERRVVTDKMPGNWLYAGAAMRMLPDARFVHCERDPVETCWSCYQQLFAAGRADFAFTFSDLAQYWADSQRLSAHWSALAPKRFYRCSYETLVSAPEESIRVLLAQVGLSFDAACLQPHTAERNIRTPSASQVRQPIRTGTARTHRYGALLDELRSAISMHSESSVT